MNNQDIQDLCFSLNMRIKIIRHIKINWCLILETRYNDTLTLKLK